MIYHLTTAIEWKLAQQKGTYTAPSLDDEGFIHCSSKQQVIAVANVFYSQVDDLIILCIDEERLNAEVRWEAPAPPDGKDEPTQNYAQRFPHVYGPINLDAVQTILEMPHDDDGYHLPEGI